MKLKQVEKIGKFMVNVTHVRIMMKFKRHIVWISNAKFDPGVNGGSVYTFVSRDA
jgi:hypothetical protein